MSLINLDRLRDTAVAGDPFDHFVVPGFLSAAALDRINADFPEIAKPGSFPAATLRCGLTFEELLDEIQGPEMAAAFAEKFAMDLTDRPAMVTVRGRCRARDGRIHTDSKSKLITVLIYLNPPWEAGGGRLRLLRGPGNIDNYALEVPPDAGTLLAFRCTETAWHGHEPFEGERRSIQLNWLRDAGVARREQRRHGLSAHLKRLSPF